jgi:hypothetical protein
LKGMEKTLAKFTPVILIEIVPFFLKGFSIETTFFQNYIEQRLNYLIFEYDKERKKLVALPGPLVKDRNYILIHRNKIHDYTHLIVLL